MAGKAGPKQFVTDNKTQDMNNVVCRDVRINDPDYWEDIIEVAFLLEGGSYISIARIPYEDRVYFEFGEQIHYCYAQQVHYEINGRQLSFEAECVKASSPELGSFGVLLKEDVTVPPNLSESLGKVFEGLLK
jgi:hypothetical protein